MNNKFVDFEHAIAELNAKIKELRTVGDNTEININDEIERLEIKCKQLTKDTFAKLTPWQVTQVARHPDRPHTSDYLAHLFTEFDELYGDRMYGQGSSIIAGLARFQGQPVVVMGHEKGRKTADKIKRNFGMPNPEDYRKTHRLMQMAEKFQLPLITFIDTPGAYPGIGAEERNQSEAIARNLLLMARLKTPIVCIVIGEGGSGGALAIGVGDRILMLQYAVYSVISPEGCASILWKTAEKSPQAAAALGLTADKILNLGIIDEVVPEPLGGAHRDYVGTMTAVNKALGAHLADTQAYSQESLLELRYKRLMAIKTDEG